jgi:hypothetical protein
MKFLHISGSDANTKSEPEVDAEGQKNMLLYRMFFLTLRRKPIKHVNTYGVTIVSAEMAREILKKNKMEVF